MILNHVRLVVSYRKEVKQMITIAELRARNGKMSQRELAKKIGTTQTSVSMWEKDISTISATNLKKLCLFFGVSSDDLLGLNAEKKICI